MRYFSVSNYQSLQHYGNRTPPWIKLYNRLLENYEFSCLRDATKAHLIAIWLLASRKQNRLPYDPRWIASKINATDPVDLEVMRLAGFIVVEGEEGVIQPIDIAGINGDASTLLADRLQGASLDKELEEEKEEDASLRSAGSAHAPTREATPPAPPPPPATPPAKKTKTRLPTRIPDDWIPTENDISFATDRGMDLIRTMELADTFRDHWQGASGKGSTSPDWSAKWRTWVQNEIRWAAERAERQPRSNGLRRGEEIGRPWGQGFTTQELMEEIIDAERRTANGQGAGSGQANRLLQAPGSRERH